MGIGAEHRIDRKFRGLQIRIEVADYIWGPNGEIAKAPSLTVIWRDFLYVRAGNHLPRVVGWSGAYL